MRRPYEQFKVVALAEHRDVRAQPMSAWPEHIALSPWLIGYPAQAIFRMSREVTGSGIITGIQLGDVLPENGRVLKNRDLEALQDKLLERAVRNDTAYLEPDAEISPPTLWNASPSREGGDHMSVSELSVVSWHMGGVVVRQNIELGERSEATA